MNIDEAIKYYTELAEESEHYANKASNRIASEMCSEDAKNNKQVVVWLNELKEYKQRYGSLSSTSTNSDLHKFKCINCGHEYEFDKKSCTLNVSVGLREPWITSRCPKCNTRNEEIKS